MNGPGCPRCPNRLHRESDQYGAWWGCICGYHRDIVTGPPTLGLVIGSRRLPEDRRVGWEWERQPAHTAPAGEEGTW